MHLGDRRLELRIVGANPRGSIVSVHTSWLHAPDEDLMPEDLAALEKRRLRAAQDMAREAGLVFGELVTDDDTSTAAQPQEGSHHD